MSNRKRPYFSVRKIAKKQKSNPITINFSSSYIGYEDLFLI